MPTSQHQGQPVSGGASNSGNAGDPWAACYLLDTNWPGRLLALSFESVPDSVTEPGQAEPVLEQPALLGAGAAEPAATAQTTGTASGAPAAASFETELRALLALFDARLVPPSRSSPRLPRPPERIRR